MSDDDEAVTPPPREHDPEVFKKIIESQRQRPKSGEVIRHDDSGEDGDN